MTLGNKQWILAKNYKTTKEPQHHPVEQSIILAKKHKVESLLM
jgi:hypothetical protein